MIYGDYKTYGSYMSDFWGRGKYFSLESGDFSDK